jgi:hypothetical protein
MKNVSHTGQFAAPKADLQPSTGSQFRLGSVKEGHAISSDGKGLAIFRAIRENYVDKRPQNEMI